MRRGNRVREAKGVIRHADTPLAFFRSGRRKHMTPLRDVTWACEQFGGRSRDMIYRWVRTGLLPAVHIGRRVLFDENRIADFIARGGCPRTGRNGPNDPEGAAAREARSEAA